MTIALKAAYAANIVILLPVVWSIFRGGDVFDGKIETSAGLLKMTGAFWLAILVTSVAGLVWPRFFVPVLMVQVAYKSVWLATFVLPLAFAHGMAAVPWGVAGTFLAIVAIYPFVIGVSLAQ
ncbi:MAG: hypothetical protein AAGB11_04485 [Pseudomonadota bacterium]